jgi:hypothetical protein
MVSLGSKGVKSEDDLGGNTRPLAGRYHVVVKDVDETFEKFDKVVVEFEVLAGTTPDQEGRTISEFFSLSEKALVRLQRLAIVLGLLKPDEEEKEVEFVQGEGRQLVIEVEDNEYEKDGEKKKGVRVSFLGMWSLANKQVADVPRDEEAVKVSQLRQAEEKAPAPAKEDEKAPAASSSDGPGGASGSDDKWADL